jgi:type I restriction enzyme S subunit
MWAWMAALGVAKQDGIVSPSYAVYRPFSPSAFLPQFTDWILRTRPYVAEYICRSTGIRSSRLRLYPEQFLRIPLVCPPISEQQEIIEYVDKTARDLDRALNQADCEISLIRAYRARLIADVVTGKLDVREAAANLLEAPEAGEPEPEGTDPLDMDAPFEPDESSDQDEREAGAVEVSDE